MIRRIVLTGAPGAGKTAVLNALASRGYECIPKSARAIIRARKERNLSARPPPVEFASEILSLDLDHYRRTAAADGLVFFDRGILDALCMGNQVGALSPELAKRYLSDYRYFHKVFAFPPWKEIYATDTERDQTYQDAVRVHEVLMDWYLQCGYELVEVPAMRVDERCTFIMEAVA